jgi:hypothetical protein
VLPFAPLVWHLGTHRDILIFTESAASWHMFGVASMMAIFPGLTDDEARDLWEGFGDLGIEKPTIYATNEEDVSVDLTSSAFVSSDITKIHTQSDWQIDEPEGDFGSPVAQSMGSTARLVQWLAAGPLQPDTLYQARVRHRDQLLTRSAWSDPIVFRTATTAAAGGGGTAGGGWSEPPVPPQPDWPACPIPVGGWVT